MDWIKWCDKSRKQHIKRIKSRCNISGVLFIRLNLNCDAQTSCYAWFHYIHCSSLWFVDMGRMCDTDKNLTFHCGHKPCLPKSEDTDHDQRCVQDIWHCQLRMPSEEQSDSCDMCSNLVGHGKELSGLWDLNSTILNAVKKHSTSIGGI